MRNKFHKFLPLVVGTFLGWLLIHPPAWLQSMGAAGWLLNILLCAGLPLSIVPLMIISNLPMRPASTSRASVRPARR